jgi:hypothetical protein
LSSNFAQEKCVENSGKIRLLRAPVPRRQNVSQQPIQRTAKTPFPAALPVRRTPVAIFGIPGFDPTGTAFQRRGAGEIDTARTSPVGKGACVVNRQVRLALHDGSPRPAPSAPRNFEFSPFHGVRKYAKNGQKTPNLIKNWVPEGQKTGKSRFCISLALIRKMGVDQTRFERWNLHSY